jgi:uncharacterized membrane protein YedE/YeeE
LEKILVEPIHSTERGPATVLRNISRQDLVAVFVLLAASALALVMVRTDALLAPLWFLGMAAGFTLQRSRFCFASAFRDLFLFGSGRIMKGILVGLSIGTIGFAINMHSQVPFPAFGVLPAEANILPVGISTIIAGLLFGIGMVLSGGCVSGSLYRMAEGYVGSWVTIGGVIIGLGLLSQTWNWWWNTLISMQTRIWLPGHLGYSSSIVLTVSGLLATFLLVLWWESRAGLTIPSSPRFEVPQDTFTQKLSVLWHTIFVQGWSVPVGGAVLGGIGVLMYMTHMPWGVTGELTRWANTIMTTMGFAPPDPLGLSDLGGCAGRAEESGVFTHTFAVTVGILPGALVGALFAKEFKLRFPKSFKRYVQSLGGGIIMGYAAGLAIGCTVGAFFSSVPSLSVSGWLFALSLAGGAFIGVQIIKRVG